jgi:hypothetical protein
LDQANLCDRRAAGAVLLALAVAGCATAPALPDTPQSQDIRRIESIAMPPVLLPGDVHDAALTRQVFKELSLQLALKGYVMHGVDRPAPRVGPSPPPLSELSPEALAGLLPDGGTHYLLCWIEELPGDGVPGVATLPSVRIAAVLIERPGRRVLWRNFVLAGGEEIPVVNLTALWFARWQRAQTPFASPVIKQLEYERAYNMFVDTQQMMARQASYLPGALRDLMSSFPVRPMP